jgi:acetylornithine aminotransferase/acetylornithine/N-succinyldiaminopimelate aminotransferase
MTELQHIMELDTRYYMNTFGPRFPVAFDSGDGCTLFDTDGKPYIDFFGGIAVNVLGYAHPRFTAAVQKQVEKLLHTSSLYYIESQARLAELLVSHSCADRVFFTNSGAEANEGAIKLARKYFFEKGEKRYEIITANQSFHGRTLATLAATGQEKYHIPFQPMPPSFVSVPYADAAAVEAAINDTTCAVMVETIQGEAGVIECPPEYLTALQDICRKHGILLIIDEIQTGMGRTGKLFSYEHFGIQPDIFTLAKALGNGVPIGAFLAKQAVADAFRPGDHGSTFGGNPLACTAGLSVLYELYNTNLMEHAARTGAYFKQALTELGQEFAFAAEVRGRGLMLGMQLDAVVNAREVSAQALKKGFVVGIAGNNTLRFTPPLLIQRGHIDALIKCLRSVLEAF